VRVLLICALESRPGSRGEANLEADVVNWKWRAERECSGSALSDWWPPLIPDSLFLLKASYTQSRPRTHHLHFSSGAAEH
jgi:hypothetical protein